MVSHESNINLQFKNFFLNQFTSSFRKVWSLSKVGSRSEWFRGVTLPVLTFSIIPLFQPWIFFIIVIDDFFLTFCFILFLVQYEKAAEALKAQGSKAVLVKVDADQKKNKKLAKTYGVEGFPTLKVIRAGATVEEYKGPRDADGIVNYVNKLTGPASLEVTKSDEAESLITKNSVLVVSFWTNLQWKLNKFGLPIFL